AFPQHDRIGAQDALALLLERLQGGIPLVRLRVHGGLVAKVDLVIGRGDLAQLTFDEQAALLEAGRQILLEAGLDRVEYANGAGLLFQLGEKARAFAIDQLRQAIDGENVTTIITAICPPDYPLAIADDNTGAWGVGGLHGVSFYCCTDTKPLDKRCTSGPCLRFWLFINGSMMLQIGGKGKNPCRPT